jgi:hypothetical protein
MDLMAHHREQTSHGIGGIDLIIHHQHFEGHFRVRHVLHEGLSCKTRASHSSVLHDTHPAQAEPS